MTRARAILAAAFAEQRYTLHPWLEHEWEPILRAANRVFSLVVQAKSVAEGETGTPNLPALKVTGTYVGVKRKHSQTISFARLFANDNYRAQTKNLFDVRAKERLTITPQILEWREGIEASENAYLELKLYALGEKLPAEAWELLKDELVAQIRMPILPLSSYSRADLHRTLGLKPEEMLWDLRIRFTDFLRRFLSCYRSDLCTTAPLTADPFTAFFVEPRALTSGTHVRSGLFGHAYVIDAGQRQYLQEEREKDPSLPTEAIQTAYLPFPDGLCAQVYLSARSSESRHVGSIIDRYIANDGELRRLEETILRNRALMEIPIYDELSMLGGALSDGPRLILCVAIPNPEDGQNVDANGDSIDGRAMLGPERERPVASPGDSPDGDSYAGALQPPIFSSYRLAEEQVVREMAHKMTKRYLSPAASRDLSEVIGISSAMVNVRRDVDRLATKDSPILITGESGTGKTRLAYAIHLASPRAQKPFKDIPSAPDDLFAAYLFGWKKGAHNKADEDFPGYAQSAAGGTLVINDVDKLTLKVQTDLLKFIDEKKFVPLGGTEEIEMDVRIFATTNQDLEAIIEAGLFREDLYYRLRRHIIHLPSLRERKEDIPIWADKFLQEFASKTSRSAALAPEAVEVLLGYDCPGNLRTLHDILDDALDLAAGGDIRPEHLTLRPAKTTGTERGAQTLTDPGEVLFHLPGNSIEEKLQVAHGILIAREYTGRKS